MAKDQLITAHPVPEADQPSDLTYGLEDKPGPGPATFAAVQHVLASFIGIITPTLIVGGVLGLGEFGAHCVRHRYLYSGPTHRASRFRVVMRSGHRFFVSQYHFERWVYCEATRRQS